MTAVPAPEGAESIPARHIHKGCGGAVTWDLAGGFCTSCHAEGLGTDDIDWPLCPGGCGCRLGTDDADRRECGCDGGCCGD